MCILRCDCKSNVCVLYFLKPDLEFKQRQAEVEKSQVTMALKIGQGMHGEVSSFCVVFLFEGEVLFQTFAYFGWGL